MKAIALCAYVGHTYAILSSLPHHRRFDCKPRPQLGIPFAAAIADGLDDAAVPDGADPESPGGQVLAVDILIFLMLGDEAIIGRYGAEDVDVYRSLVDISEVRG